MASTLQDNPGYVQDEEDNNEIIELPGVKNGNSVPLKTSKSSQELITPKREPMIYDVEDTPAWYLSAVLGIQHCLLAIGGLVGMPLIFAPFLCMKEDEIGYLGRAMVINSVIFVSGIMSFLQTTFGVRLPIMQGASAAFTTSILATLNLQRNQCPSEPIETINGTNYYNDTDGMIVDGTELWQRRMREIQGALIMSSLVEILLSVTGAAGFLMRYIGPLVVAPSLCLIGLSLVGVAGNYASGHWGIAALTFGLLIIFSQYLKDVKVPFFFYNRRKGCHVQWTNFFKLFPVLITVIIACIICVILTATGVFPDDPKVLGYGGRTDTKIEVLNIAPWFRFPYPGQWGLPVITGAGVVGMIAATIISMVESIGDYHACARISLAPPPPIHAFNRGLAIEGLGSLVSAVVGTSTATTSYSQNVAAIGITRVASRRVLQAAGIVFFVIGMVGKFGAVIVVIPDPVMGGIFCVMFGMISAVGISNLQYVDLNSARNLFILGFSIFMGLTVPSWLKANPGVIQTGVTELDQIFTVLLQTELFIGFLLALILDNTVPGTKVERGMHLWLQNEKDLSNDMSSRVARCYDLPFKTNCCRLSRYIPVLPEFKRAPGTNDAEKNSTKD